jgi:hypothetical protein
MTLLTSGRYAAVTSTLALVVALGGTSYAAVKITGNDIKDGTVTTADVKDHNLKLKDFSSSATHGLTGPKGAKGAKGDPGGKGDTGLTGPSDAYAVPSANSTLTGLGPTATVLGAVVLPAGSYVASGKTIITHNDGGNPQTDAGVTTCELQQPGTDGPATDLDVSNLRMPTGKLLSLTVTVQAAFTLDATTTIQFLCATSGTSNGAGASQFQVIKVGQLHLTP